MASERRGKKAYYKIRDEHREALEALFSLPDDIRSEVIKVANLLAEAEEVSARVNVVVLALYYFHVFLAAFGDSVDSSANPFNVTLFQ